MNPLEEQLVAYYYGEADDAAAVEKLLADDPAARLLYEELSAMLAEVRPAEPPERSDDYPRRVWERLQWRLGEPRVHFRWWEFLTVRQAAPAVLLAAFIIAVFFVGRYSGGPADSPAAGISAGARQQILLIAVGNHFDRSQLVLIELLNAPSGDLLDVRGEREEADDLLTDNRLYQAAAEQAGKPLIAEVLDDLERVWIELRHSPDKLSPDDITRLRAMLEERGTLFKIRVINAGIQEEQQNQARSPEIEVF
jgi:hypothetical protein